VNERHDEDRRDDRLARSIELLAAVLYGLGRNNGNNEQILMKLSEVKTEIAAVRADNDEAFAELGTRIADLDKQIAELVAAATDPEITDEVFLTNLTALRASSIALKDIVPNAPPA